MQEAIYPVPQGAAPGVGPSHLVFRLPDTLPVVSPIQGLPRDPTVAGLPRLIFVTADIVSAAVLRGVPQDPFTVGAPDLLLTTAEIVSRVILRGLLQEPLIVGPPKLLLVTADIVSRALLQGLPQSPFAVVLPTIFPVPTPAPAAPLAVQIPIRGAPQEIVLPGTSTLVKVPLAELVSRITLRGLSQDVPTVGPPMLFRVVATAPVALAVQRPLVGGSQEPFLVGPPQLVRIPTAEIVSRAMLRGLPQEAFVVGAPMLFKFQPPAPVPFVPFPLQGLRRDPFVVAPSVILKPARPEIVSGIVLRGLQQALLTVGAPGLIQFLPRFAPAGLIFVTREGGIIPTAGDELGRIVTALGEFGIVPVAVTESGLIIMATGEQGTVPGDEGTGKSGSGG